jgi:hypothetical protein
LNAAELISSLRSLWFRRRAAALPTVWSNCLAGWWLGGGERYRELLVLLVGATLLYLGASLWCDVLATEGNGEHGPSVILAASAARWLTALKVVLPGVGRVLLYLIGAFTGANGVTAASVWCGLALGVYIAGTGWVLRQKDTTGPSRHWPALPLAAPIILALVMNSDSHREAALLLSAVLALWTVRCLRPALWSAQRDFTAVADGLVAGIAFVDLLAVGDAPRPVSAVFIALFLLTRLAQRYAVGPEGHPGQTGSAAP